MPSPTYYRAQAHRCLLLSRSTVDQQSRLWLTDMASYYAEKAKWLEENGVATFQIGDPSGANLPRNHHQH
jgi:hypothetical protein